MWWFNHRDQSDPTPRVGEVWSLRLRDGLDPWGITDQPQVTITGTTPTWVKYRFTAPVAATKDEVMPAHRFVEVYDPPSHRSIK